MFTALVLSSSSCLRSKPDKTLPPEQDKEDEDVGPGGQGLTGSLRLTGPLRLLRPLLEDTNEDISGGDDEDNSEDDYELAEPRSQRQRRQRTSSSGHTSAFDYLLRP